MDYVPVTLSGHTIGQERPKTISLSNRCTKTFIRIDKADTLFIGIYEKLLVDLKVITHINKMTVDLYNYDF